MKGKKKKVKTTQGKSMGPTNNWKILSDDKWVMVPNRMGCFKWWVMSDENWVMSDGWWKLSDEWPFFLNQTRQVRIDEWWPKKKKKNQIAP